MLIAVEVAPRVRNYPAVGFAVFDAEERKVLGAALLKAKKKREGASDRRLMFRARKAHFSGETS